MSLALAALAALATVGGVALGRSVGKRSKARTRGARMEAARRRERGVETFEGPVVVSIALFAMLPYRLVWLLAPAARPGFPEVLFATDDRYFCHFEAAAVVFAKRKIGACHCERGAGSLTNPPSTSVAGCVASLVQRRGDDA